MKIDGRTIADTILAELKKEITRLVSTKHATPTLAVIQVGDDRASLAYIKQKQKAAEAIGANIVLSHQPSNIRLQTLRAHIKKYSNDSSIHGLIVQRPLPKELGDVSKILDRIAPVKDVDGFLPNSPYPVPVAKAVEEILKDVHSRGKNENEFLPWLQQKNIVIVGRGETAGAPIASYLQKLKCATSVVHSLTPNPEKVLKQADIIISCVGKKDVITVGTVKPRAILLSVGIWRDTDGKLHGDYNEADLGRIASFYTPTPGGVGPVNVACLMQNLVKAAQNA